MTTGNLEPQIIPVNGYTTTDAIVLVASMPGVMPDDVTIEVEGSRVVLRAALRTDAPKAYFLHEWEYGDYERVIELPEPVGGRVTATLGHGQLAVSLPRNGATPDGRIVAHPTMAGTV